MALSTRPHNRSLLFGMVPIVTGWKNEGKAIAQKFHADRGKRTLHNTYTSLIVRDLKKKFLMRKMNVIKNRNPYNEVV